MTCFGRLLAESYDLALDAQMLPWWRVPTNLGTDIEDVDMAELLQLCGAADHVVAIDRTTAWWAGFLSPMARVINLEAVPRRKGRI